MTNNNVFRTNPELADVYEEAADMILINGLSIGPKDDDSEARCVVLSLRAAEVKLRQPQWWLSGSDLLLPLRHRGVAEPARWSDALAETPNGWAVVRDTLLACAKDLRA